MQFTIEVGRYNPENRYDDSAVEGQQFPPPWNASPVRRYQTYSVDLPEHAVVLDALIAIREYQDQSLAVRCACRSAICGSCAMWINGHANLACKSKLADFTKDGKTRVESPPSMPIIRDLVCDMQPFWDKHLAVRPWLENKKPIPPPDRRVPRAQRLDGGADPGGQLHQLRRLPDGLRVVCGQPRLPRTAGAGAGLPLRRRSARRPDTASAWTSSASRAVSGIARTATSA